MADILVMENTGNLVTSSGHPEALSDYDPDREEDLADDRGQGYSDFSVILPHIANSQMAPVWQVRKYRRRMSDMWSLPGEVTQ